ETAILCRDDADYDAMVKVLCVAARRRNVIVIIYAVVSNHCHVAILAEKQKDADDYGQEIKKVYAMWFNRRYGEKSIMRHVDVKSIWLDNDWYVRNALAYIPRNALDNGCNVTHYRWSGYRAMFKNEPEPGPVRSVSGLTKRERERILHTGDRLNGVNWLIDSQDQLIPESFCDSRYLEQVFENDPSFFLKTIGGQNVAEMENKLINSPRQRQTDGDFFKYASEISQRWFQSELSSLSTDRKTRVIPYLYRTTKTTVPQLARIFGLPREVISRIIGKK
ncbi:MAG: transposase, partial [Bacteroidales bacterium]|nr:transposase [Bacteroidales bacterium]